MILYNMRYRGPYEYEKFILNVFQYHNEVLRLKEELYKDNEKNLKEYGAQLSQLEEAVREANDKLLAIRERISEV